jgi:hypothetical protein
MNNLDPLNNPDALVAWTIEEARKLSPEHHAPSELEAKPSPNRLLEVLAAEALQMISQGVDHPSNELDAENLTAPPTSQVVAEPNPITIFSKPTQDAPLISPDILRDPKSLLLKAIVEPDIYTAPGDRNRAINLRWTLRDIKSNRLKLLPVNQHDLQDLIDMGLVEMRDDAPVLSNAGAGVIS